MIRKAAIRFGLIGLLAAPFVAAAADKDVKISLPKDRPIVVRADSVSSDPERDLTVFRGNFEVEGTDWPIQADLAQIFGPIENPTRVIISGKPARMWLRYKGVDRDISAEAAEIELQRKPDIVKLRGGAKLVRSGRMTLEGDHFEYDISAGKIIKSGPVRITVLPSSKSTATPAPAPAAATAAPPSPATSTSAPTP